MGRWFSQNLTHPKLKQPSLKRTDLRISNFKPVGNISLGIENFLNVTKKNC